VQEVLDVPNEVAVELAGIGDGVLGALRERLGCAINLRGNRLTLEGDDLKVGEAKAVVEELVDLVESGQEIGAGTVDTILNAIDQAEDVRDIFEDVVWSHRGKRITPKTVVQKRYVDAIRKCTITFGIGPAGTGKTYLAIALAVSALSERQVGRIILTRPAVEAGERLGFLPGDVLAKVDPYMRPLFDALYDTMDPEKLNAYIERGTIEVAPLAFMRGRAQPVTSPVLTPDGFVPIGSLRVGDLVIASDGCPTPVLGVYPQGRKEVYRVRAQDGASTLCCAEHLWQVRTPRDRRSGKPGRVLETGKMIGKLRQAHQHRFELPLLSAPAEFEAQDVPMDPYALGLLLGDGCYTAAASRSFSSSPGGRGGVIVADPATETLRELHLAGIDTRSTFIPACYQHNSIDIRIALLQGLMDSDGGRVAQRARACRILFTAYSERLRDDVTYLVRSLGGVAHRHDAFVMDLRLPANVAPFRLRRKLELYEKHGSGRPMRFIDSIEPAGEAETVCIAVLSADSLYVTDDFLLTHNTLNDSFIILDEAQNTSPEQMQMFLTRLGFGSKVVVTGDVTQIDLPREQASGLIQVQNILGDIDGIQFVQFSHQDVVRHKLVQRIVEAYKLHSEETGTARKR